MSVAAIGDMASQKWFNFGASNCRVLNNIANLELNIYLSKLKCMILQNKKD